MGGWEESKTLFEICLQRSRTQYTQCCHVKSFFRCLISSIFDFTPHLVQVVAETYIDPNDEESWIITLIKHALDGVPVQLNMSKLWIIQHVCCEGIGYSPQKYMYI